MTDNWRKLLTPDKSLNMTDTSQIKDDIEQPPYKEHSLQEHSFGKDQSPVEMTLDDIGLGRLTNNITPPSCPTNNITPPSCPTNNITPPSCPPHRHTSTQTELEQQSSMRSQKESLYKELLEDKNQEIRQLKQTNRNYQHQLDHVQIVMQRLKGHPDKERLVQIFHRKVQQIQQIQQLQESIRNTHLQDQLLIDQLKNMDVHQTFKQILAEHEHHSIYSHDQAPMYSHDQAPMYSHDQAPMYSSLHKL